MYLTNEECLEIRGGAGLSGSLINALSRLSKTLYDIGYALGSSIRSATAKKYCK